jgi:hypothetical protein
LPSYHHQYLNTIITHHATIVKKVVQAQKLEEKQIKEALERLRDEQRRLAIAEQSIRDMEGAEEAFIDRLKQAQVDERKAYELLKGVVQD